MKIIEYPNDILSVKAKNVEKFDSDLKDLLNEMKDTLLKSGGIGLAAPQVGISKRIIVIDDGLIRSKDDKKPKHHFLYIINPETTWFSEDTDIDKEGCLSFPELYIEVRRSISVEVTYQDETGKQRTRKAQGLLARCFQHEIDHIDGITMIDRLAGIKKVKALLAYSRLNNTKQN